MARRTRQIGRVGGTPERPAVFFTGPEEFRAWLDAHHASADELWMGLHKAHVADRGLTWADAVPEALAYGWIDSKSERIDDDSRRQRWTPRRKGSNWSRVNVALVEQLTAEGRMAAAGIAAFEARREDRTGVYSFENPTPELTPDHLALLAASPAATAFWEVATAGYRKVCVAWVTTAKQQATRDSRMAQLIDDCAHGRRIKSQAYDDPPKWVARAAEAAAAASAASG